MNVGEYAAGNNVMPTVAASSNVPQRLPVAQNGR